MDIYRYQKDYYDYGLYFLKEGDYFTLTFNASTLKFSIVILPDVPFQNHLSSVELSDEDRVKIVKDSVKLNVNNKPLKFYDAFFNDEFIYSAICALVKTFDIKFHVHVNEETLSVDGVDIYVSVEGNYLLSNYSTGNFSVTINGFCLDTSSLRALLSHISLYYNGLTWDYLRDLIASTDTYITDFTQCINFLGLPFVKGY